MRWYQLDAACWVSRGEGVKTKYSTGSFWRPCSLLVIFHLLLLLLLLCRSCLFLSLAFLIYSLVLLSNLWNCTWNMQQRWSLFIHILCSLRLYICNPMYKKCKLSIGCSRLLLMTWNAPEQWVLLYSKWFSLYIIFVLLLPYGVTRCTSTALTVHMVIQQTQKVTYKYF